MQGYSLCVLRMSCVLDTIAGWGSWSDEGLKPMKDLVTYQFRTECLRKDDKNEHVTMNKHQDKKIAKHLVCVGSVTAATHYCLFVFRLALFLGHILACSSLKRHTLLHLDVTGIQKLHSIGLLNLKL